MKLTINKNSTKDKKLLKDLRDLRESIKPTLALYQRMPEAKKELWLENDIFMKELFEFASKITNGKSDD